jgi:hypothetical protein
MQSKGGRRRVAEVAHALPDHHVLVVRSTTMAVSSPSAPMRQVPIIRITKEHSVHPRGQTIGVRGEHLINSLGRSWAT